MPGLRAVKRAAARNLLFLRDADLSRLAGLFQKKAETHIRLFIAMICKTDPKQKIKYSPDNRFIFFLQLFCYRKFIN